MAISPVSSSPRRLLRPIESEQSGAKRDNGSAHAQPSKPFKPGASLSQLKSVLVTEVMARQQAANTSGTAVDSDPISQNFVESFSAAAADPKAFDELLTSIFGDDID